MATKSCEKDALVQDSIERHGIGVRELLRHALGFDPNNILSRLKSARAIESCQKGLPQNRAYYLPGGERPLGAQALHQRLGLAWYTLMESVHPCIKLKDCDLRQILGAQAPPGPHVLQEDEQGKAHLLHVYIPETIEVVPGIVRHVAKAKTFPKVASAIDDGLYGFLVLMPWASGHEQKLMAALDPKVVTDVPGVSGLPYNDWKTLRALSKEVRVLVGKTASPTTLSLALGEFGNG